MQLRMQTVRTALAWSLTMRDIHFGRDTQTRAS